MSVEKYFFCDSVPQSKYWGWTCPPCPTEIDTPGYDFYDTIYDTISLQCVTLTQHVTARDQRQTSSSESKKIRMSTFGRLDWQVFIVEVQHKLLGLEAELLVKQHCGITSRHVKSYILAHARLKTGIHEQ